MVDDLGAEVRLPERVRRVVSLLPPNLCARYVMGASIVSMLPAPTDAAGSYVSMRNSSWEPRAVEHCGSLTPQPWSGAGRKGKG